MRKVKFFLIGLVPGLLVVFFILNQKGVSCSGYLPNSRVVAETLSKDFTYTESFQKEMAANGVNEQFLKDSIITKGQVDFDRSKAQQKPCPEYTVVYPEKNPRFEVIFEKCKEGATFSHLKKVGNQ